MHPTEKGETNMKRILSFLIAAVMSVTALTACGSDDSSSETDGKSVSTESSGRTKLGKAAAGAAIGLGALILIPSMNGYVKKSQQKTADSNAKMLYTIVSSAILDFEYEGKPIRSSCAGRQVKLSELANSTDFDKQVYDDLYQSIDGDSLICFELDGNKVTYAAWQKNKSSPVGTYPRER